MNLVKDAINDHGCRGAIVDPELFSPLDYWLRKTVIQPGSQKDYEKYFISGRAIAVNCFVQSTAELEGPTLRDTLQWPTTSLWFAVLYGRYVRETRSLAKLPAIHTVAEDIPGL